YSMAQASKAIIPVDAGGPWGKRIGVSVQGGLGWALRVGAYSTKRVSSTDWNPWDDNSATSWNPIPVTATFEFRGVQAPYTFPVANLLLAPQTTLWWYGAPS
ncbi:hypothetical protein DFH06DRAFT_918265, partial [Mycena polygramma]